MALQGRQGLCGIGVLAREREVGERAGAEHVDARMQEVYAGAFVLDGACMVPVAPECVTAAAEWRPPPGTWAGAGSGWSYNFV